MKARSNTRRLAPLPASIDAAATRKRLLGRVHIMSGELALSDESYRDVLERITTHRSAALCSDQQLYDVIRELERLGAGRKGASGRPLADSSMARKARALWTNLWNLAEIDDGSEQALSAFVKRQSGKEDMRFCNAAEISTVIEALKDMCGRSGLDMPADIDPLEARRRVVREQWRRLHAAGWAKVDGDSGLAGFAHRSWCVPNSRTVDDMEAEHLDKLAGRLGRMVREQQLGQSNKTPPKE